MDKFCFGCNQPLGEASPVGDLLGRSWHDGCFAHAVREDSSGVMAAIGRHRSRVQERIQDVRKEIEDGARPPQGRFHLAHEQELNTDGMIKSLTKHPGVTVIRDPERQG